MLALSRRYWVRPLLLLVSILLVFGAFRLAERPVEAGFPGQNGRLVYASCYSGGTGCGILTQNPDGSCVQTILPDNGFPIGPVWSPNGSRIVFQGGELNDHNKLVTMNADGSDVTVLDDTTGDYFPAWSPDGTRLVVSSFHDNSAVPDLHLIDADGSNRTPLTQTASDAERYPVWSPDGQRIAFEMDGDIYTIQPDGGGLTNLTNHPAADSWPDWSPDGLKLVFLSDRGGNPDELYVMDADGANPAPLANPAYGETPVWSPDGMKIAYVRDQSTLTIINADGSGRQDIGLGDFPDWQPDLMTVTQLDVEKKVLMVPPPAWAFNLSGVGPFQLPGAGGCKTFTNLESGAYTLQEETVPDVIQSVSCNGGESGSTAVQFNLSEGEHAVCTFINGTLPRLEIVKDVVGPAPATAWQFSGSDPVGAFELPAAGGNIYFEDLPPGEYTIAETPVAGYASSVICADFGTPEEYSITIDLNLGESKICRFTNNKTADLTIEKVVVGPAPDTDWHFYASNLGEFNLPATGGTYVFEDVLTGHYNLAETQDFRFTTSVICTDGSVGEDYVQISLNGEPVTCTFTNAFIEMAFLAYIATP